MLRRWGEKILEEIDDAVPPPPPPVVVVSSGGEDEEAEAEPSQPGGNGVNGSNAA